MGIPALALDVRLSTILVVPFTLPVAVSARPDRGLPLAADGQLQHQLSGQLFKSKRPLLQSLKEKQRMRQMRILDIVDFIVIVSKIRNLKSKKVN